MKIAVIGGGAAGLMAAATILEHNSQAEVFLIEQNASLGKKVLLSGGGRCNLTTGNRDLKFLFSRYPRGAKFLSSALYGFPPAAVYDWFEAHGVPLKIEKDARVFPVSNDGHDVVRAFTKIFTSPQMNLLLAHTVKKITRAHKKFIVHFIAAPDLIVDKIILTTGGQAYRHTGSTGAGYTFAENFGHTITPLAASLNSFVVQELWIKKLAGVSFTNVGLRTAGAPLATPISSPLLFTHTGLTGPAVFAFSSLLAYAPATPQQPLPLWLNLFPEKKPAEFLRDLQVLYLENPKRTWENVLATLLPKSVAKSLCALEKIADTRAAATISKKELAAFATLLQNIPVHAIGRSAGDEFVTAGGVALTEVNPSTMESRLTPGLFFAGEILDVDAFTGGFNLQASWATGRLAGLSAAK